MLKAINVLITSKDEQESQLIRELSSLTGLKPTTALKMFLREALPTKIAELQHRNQEVNLTAVE